MKCPECGSVNLSSAVVCVRCKASLSTDRAASSDHRCPQCGTVNLSSARICLRCSAELGISARPQQNLASHTVSSGEIASRFSEKQSYLGLIDPGVFSLDTRMAEIEQIFGFVIHSPHVTTNPSFKARANETSLVFIEDDYMVNAFASDQGIPELNASPPVVGIFGGLCHASKLASIAASVCLQGEGNQLLIDCFSFLGSHISNSGTFSLSDLSNGVSSLQLESQITEEIQRKSRSFFSAMLLAVIAHEIGHICYHHTLGDRSTLEVSRNQERDADSFASSVISTTPFSDYNCYGSALWWMVLTWVEESAPDLDRAPTTHPISRERLNRLLCDNESQFQSLELSPDNIDRFLP